MDLPPEAVVTEIRRRQAEARGLIFASDIAASKDRCSTLAGFIREAWHIIEPMQEYVHGWHIDMIAEHLEAITYGDLLAIGQENRLLINVPPGTMKSLLTSVFWPAWEWGPAGLPGLRYLTTSYQLEGLAIRDSRRMRDLVMSDWYQARWPITLNRTAEDDFANTDGGSRIAMAFKNLTGGRGDRLIIDDPHSVDTAESETVRDGVTRTFRESVPLRLNDPTLSAIVVIMQRLNVDDVSGVIERLKLPYVRIMLPMEFEPERACETPLKRRGFEEKWRDLRTMEGELLFPERFTKESIERDKRPMGAFAIAGQFQQRPTLREGSMFKRGWFRPIPAAPKDVVWVRGWDLAATEERVGQKPAYTAGVKLGRVLSTGRYVIGHAIRERADGNGVRTIIKTTAAADGREVEISLPQDPGQAGKVQARDMVLMLAGYIARATPESGSKETRAEPLAAQAEAGNVDIVAGDWNEAFLDEASTFPGGSFKDQIDAASRAFEALVGGNVFNADENEMIVEPLAKLPGHWQQAFALVMDAKNIAAVYMARDPRTDTVYLVDEYTAARGPLPVHAEALKKRAPWIPGLFDLEDAERSEQEGLKIAERLAGMGVDISTATMDVDAGAELLMERLNTGRLKAFNTMPRWLAAYRRYRTDGEGETVEDGVQLIRATAFLMQYGLEVAKTENRYASDNDGFDPSALRGYSSSTGYS